MLFRKNCSPVLRRNEWRFERVFSEIICFPDIQPREGTELNHPGGFSEKNKKLPPQKLRKQ